MTLSARSGGQSHLVSKVFAKSGGVWRDCVGVWIKDGGVWRRAFNAAVATLTGNNFAAEALGFSATVSVHFAADGSVTYSAGGGNDHGNWLTPNSPSAGAPYYIRLTLGAGNGNMNGTYGSWVSLGAGATWSMNPAGVNQLKQRSTTYEISTDQSTVLASGTITFLNNNL